jgi:hypothetical protein
VFGVDRGVEMVKPVAWLAVTVKRCPNISCKNGLTPKSETFGTVTTCIQWGRILCAKGRGRHQMSPSARAGTILYAH